MRTSPQIFVGDCLIGRLCSRRVLMWRVERDSQSRTACRILQRHREHICIRTCSHGQSFLMASVWVDLHNVIWCALSGRQRASALVSDGCTGLVRARCGSVVVHVISLSGYCGGAGMRATSDTNTACGHVMYGETRIPRACLARGAVGSFVCWVARTLDVLSQNYHLK